MKYAIKTHGRIGQRQQRLALSEIGEAIVCLESMERGEVAHATHEARKHFKKLRAILRLLRESLDGTAFKTENACFREASHRLRALRDAHVLVGALDVLRKRIGQDRHAAVVTHARRLLAADEARELERLKHADCGRQIVAKLREAAGRIECWKLDSFGWKESRAAIRRSYRQARIFGQKASDNPSSDHLHDWRKRVKDLCFHAQLLHRADPAWMDIFIHELDVLAEFLGDAHDLAVLRDALTERRETLGRPRQFSALLEMLDLRRHELICAALDLGARLFADPPAQFARELDEKRDTHRTHAARLRKLAARLGAV